MEILFIHGAMFPAGLWDEVAAMLAAESAIRLRFCTAAEVDDQQLLRADIVVADLDGLEPRKKAQLTRSVANRIAVGGEESGFTTFSPAVVAAFRGAIATLSRNNFAAAVERLAAETGFATTVRDLEEVQVSGLFHPAADRQFPDTAAYLAWRCGRQLPLAPKIAILLYYGQLVEGSIADVNALINAIEERGFCPLPIFSAGVGEDEVDWIALLDGLELTAIINCMAGRLLRTEEESAVFARFDVPVIQALRSWSQSEEEWRADPDGLPPMSTAFLHTLPELFGAIRPVIISCRSRGPEAKAGQKNYLPLTERIATLCDRLAAQYRLKTVANADKRLTIVLHNNPCKGVEATVGMAVGLDTFASLARVLKALKREGWDVGDAPFEGSALYQEIIERKAVAEFRWTTVDEIVAKGGALELIAEEEYRLWYDTLDHEVRRSVEEDWGAFPGRAMVWRHNGTARLVISGIRYGNITIINQPKRGCYGAKCNGEVCRILHNPSLAPSHHWLATYHWIATHSDAVLHFGTQGALEFLPGKRSALSATCFPEISIGSLPNFYLYVMDAVGEGLVAKRRAQATLVDHLPPICSPTRPNEELARLETLLEQYRRAETAGNSGQQRLLTEELTAPLARLFPGSDATFADKVTLARTRIAAIRRSLTPHGLHLLGEIPQESEQEDLAATMLRRNPQRTDRRFCDNFTTELRIRLAQTPGEIDNLLHALAGGYVPPGRGGSLAAGDLALLPGGRNLYACDISLLPTRTAWQAGQQRAEALLARYREDEGRTPQRVALSIWSTDAFKNDGELLCQILALLGVAPLWNERGRVESLAVIPLDELQRPRIDVTVTTSQVMREMVPRFCELIDRAVRAVCELDESDDDNFVARHFRQTLAALYDEISTAVDDAEMRRLASFRLFSSAAGGGGGGVGLALDASAWRRGEDLAEIHVNANGYAWHDGRMVAAHDLFARQLAEVDVACISQAGAEYDILDSDCFVAALGGMAAAAGTLGSGSRLYWIEAADEAEVSEVGEQLERSTAARLLNREWLAAMRKHGAAGAMAVSSRVNTLYKWSATTHEVTTALFDRVVEFYIRDEEIRTWLLTENPFALEEISRRLLEARGRGLWQAGEELFAVVRETALRIEGEMEERIGEVDATFQGGAVEIIGEEDVATWRHHWKFEKTK